MKILFVDCAAGVICYDIGDVIARTLLQALLIVVGMLGDFWNKTHDQVISSLCSSLKTHFLIDLVHLSIFPSRLLAFFSVPLANFHLKQQQKLFILLHKRFLS